MWNGVSHFFHIGGSWLRMQQTNVTSAGPTNLQMKRILLPTDSPRTTPSCRSQLSFKSWCTLSFRPSEIDTKKERHKQNEGRPSSRQVTRCSNCNKNRRTQTSQLNSKGLVAQVPSRPHAFPGIPYPGQCDCLTPPSQAPNPSRRE